MSAAKSISSSTVAGQEQAGSSVAVNTTMKTSKSGGAASMKHGMSFLGSGISPNAVPGVQAGTMGPSTGAVGANQTVTSSKATVPGRGAAVTEVPAKAMKVGSSKGNHKGFL